MRLDVTITSVLRMVHLEQHGNVGENDAPSLSEAGPGLALPAAFDLACGVPLEGNRDAGEVFAECDDLEPCNGARQVGWRSALAKRLDLFDSVQCLRGTEARDVGRGPEHGDQGLDIVGDERLFVPRIEFAQLGYGVGVIDLHVAQNIFRVGSTHLGMAAQTVIIGSFTTWLMRSFIATLHSK